MTKGDKQKIQAMVSHGMSGEDICFRYRHRYSAAEVEKAMIPPKPRRRKAEAKNDEQSLNM